MIDYRLLRGYFKGTGSIEERKKIEEWFSSMKMEKELRKVSGEFWDEISEDITIRGYDEEKIHGRIHHMLRLEEARNYNKNKAKIKFIRYLTRIAAVLFIPLLFLTIFNWEGRMAGKESISSSEIFSPRGARTNFILPDGSSGWLNGGSYLKFKNEFSGKSRSVELQGEAYFEIETDPDKPFEVLTHEIIIKAHGTTFNVMAYPDDKNINVTTESGIIEVLGKDGYGREISFGDVKPGYNWAIIKGTNLTHVNEVNIDQYVSWKEGKLVLRNESMIEVVKKINRWYNVNIIIKDSRLETYRYRASFVDETLDEVLKLLQMTSPIKCKELGREKKSDGTYGKRTVELHYSPK